MNIWTKLGLTAAILFGSSKIFAAKSALKVGNSLKVNIKDAAINKVIANPFNGGIELKIIVELHNPTDDSIVLTQPYTQLLSDDLIISSTERSNKQFKLNAFSKITLDPILFVLTWPTIIAQLSRVNAGIPREYSVFQKVSYLISNYKAIVAKLRLGVKYTTEVNGLYYSDIQNLNF